jgi:hypothetical protein
VHLKFFTPDSDWTWFVTEGQPQDDDFIFFGFVCGFEEEWGYFMLSELAGIGGRGVCRSNEIFTSIRDCSRR